MITTPPVPSPSTATPAAAGTPKPARAGAPGTDKPKVTRKPKTSLQKLRAAQLLVNKFKGEVSTDLEDMRTHALCVVGGTVATIDDNALKARILNLIVKQKDKREVQALFDDKLETLLEQ